MRAICAGILLLCFCGPLPAGETHLQSVAAGLKPGGWAELKTEGYTAELLKAQNHHILEYAGAAAWDPKSKQVLFVGQGHYSALKFIGYAERTNAWTLRATPAWWDGDPKTGKGPIGHAYYNNAIDAGRGLLYLHQSGSRRVHRFDIAADRWTTLPEIKDASVGHGTAIVHFPERGGLFRVLGGSVHFFGDAADGWTRLPDKTPMGPYHNIAQYSAKQKLVLFGGGNGSKDLYRMDAQGTITKLQPAPVEIGINTAVVTVDPVSGDFLILHKSDAFYSLNATTDTWKELPTAGMPFAMKNSSFDVIATPVAEHGVTFFFTAAVKGLKVCVYKHADVALEKNPEKKPEPPPTPMAKPLEEAWDFALPMKKVAAGFKGNEGVVVHLGGSMTIANPYGTWARTGKGHTPADDAVLKWMHTEKKDKTDGWWLCRTELEHYRAYTSESGLKSAMLFAGGKRGLPTLERILAEYKPRLVTIECGIYDVEDGVPLDEYRANMARALDLILESRAIPILNTIPPFKAQLERTKQFNEALRGIAKDRGVPVLDLEREIFSRRADDWFGTLVDRIHLTAARAGVSPGSEPTTENLRQSGYLLRGCLTVRKIAEVKGRVLD